MNNRTRRKFFKKAFATALGTAIAGKSLMAAERNGPEEWQPTFKDAIKITRLETFKVQPRFLFLKIHTDAGIVGLGEPITEGR
ncbi:MAG: galactonate dehydratase, partial [Saprospiraceae bacterium]|nr:galactonate dehydratase [Saprospiraceae bacterium]